MGGRNVHRGTPNWVYVFIGLLLLVITGSLTFLTSFVQENNLHVDNIARSALLSLKITDLKEKVLKTKTESQDIVLKNTPTSLQNALADLKRERLRSLSVLAEITSELDGIVKLLTTHLSKKEVLDMIATSVRNKPLENVSKDEQEIKYVAKTTSSIIRAQSQDDDYNDEVATSSDPLYDFFMQEEIRTYIKVMENRGGLRNFMGVNSTYGAIGHACVTNKPLLEKYMDYKVGGDCRDDWLIAQQLIIRGCEPLPRRRCRARGPQMLRARRPTNVSLWTIPADDDFRWDSYYCKNFTCLADYKHRKKFFKCNPCFDLLGHEKQRWVVPNTTDAEFLIEDVLTIKPGELRIGLDYSMGTGTFAARMKEHDITIITATLNLGAPFSETIAHRGLVPLYISINQRLPFFDNTLDIVHTTLLLDGWIDHQLLDFVLFDFDRVLRPGGLLWIDRFFSVEEDISQYVLYFKRLRYKVHRWTTVPKTDRPERNEVYFSAVWEKPHSPSS